MLDGFFLLILIRWHPRPTNINVKTKTPLHNLSSMGWPSQIPHRLHMGWPMQIPCGPQAGYVWAQAGMVRTSPYMPITISVQSHKIIHKLGTDHNL